MFPRRPTERQTLLEPTAEPVAVHKNVVVAYVQPSAYQACIQISLPALIRSYLSANACLRFSNAVCSIRLCGDAVATEVAIAVVLLVPRATSGGSGPGSDASGPGAGNAGMPPAHQATAGQPLGQGSREHSPAASAQAPLATGRVYEDLPQCGLDEG